MKDVREQLDGYEAIAQQHMDRHGWQLERKPFSAGPHPAGWNYSQFTIGADADPFTVRYFTRWMPTREAPAHGHDVAQQCWRLQDLMLAIWTSREAMTSRNVAACLAAGIAIERAAQRFDEPAVLTAVENRAQQRKARKPRRPKLRTRALLAVIRQGYRTADHVEEYLRQEPTLSDGWGDMEVYVEGDGFQVIASGTGKCAEIPTDRLKRLTADALKSS